MTRKGIMRRVGGILVGEEERRLLPLRERRTGATGRDKEERDSRDGYLRDKE